MADASVTGAHNPESHTEYGPICAMSIGRSDILASG